MTRIHLKFVGPNLYVVRADNTKWRSTLALSSTILRPSFINICQLVQTLLQYSCKDRVSFVKDDGNKMIVSRKLQIKMPYARNSVQICKDLQLVFTFGTR